MCVWHCATFESLKQWATLCAPEHTFHLSVCLLSFHRLDKRYRNFCCSVSSAAAWQWILISAKSRRQTLLRGHRASCDICVRVRLCVCVILCAFRASDWSPVARSGELCELWCSLTAAFSWKASLWGPAGFQCAHLHIKTAQERDSAQGGWGTAEGGRAG